MASLFDKIRDIFGISVNAEGEAEPVVSQQAEPLASQPVTPQVSELPNNEIYHVFLRSGPEPQKEAEIVDVQDQKPSHAGEVELLKHYAELAKQNALDRAALNEDLE